MITHWKDLSEDYDEKYVFRQLTASGRFPKKHRLGPQNSFGSLGPKKLLKIVKCATIKETEKLKEAMVGVQVEFMGGYQYPPGSSPLRKKWSPLH